MKEVSKEGIDLKKRADSSTKADKEQLCVTSTIGLNSSHGLINGVFLKANLMNTVIYVRINKSSPLTQR